MKLSALRDKTTRITVEWSGETADMDVYLGRLTQELYDEVGNATSVDQVNEKVAELVEWWDIVDDDGNTMSATADTCRKLPLPLIRTIVESMVGAGSDEGKASPDG